MTDTPEAYAAKLIRLYLDSPDTPQTPSSADWDVASDLARRGVPLATMDLAIKIAFVRRRLGGTGHTLAPIRSLAYFRTVALSLAPHEIHPAYAEYIHRLHDQLRSRHSQDSSTACSPAENRAR